MASAFISTADFLPIGNLDLRASQLRIALIMQAALSASVHLSPLCLSSGFCSRRPCRIGIFLEFSCGYHGMVRPHGVLPFNICGGVCVSCVSGIFYNMT